MLLLYFTADELFEDQAIERQNALEFIAKIITDTEEHPLLRIQALRTFTKCSDGLDPQKLVIMLNYCLEIINSTHTGMRIMCIRAIGVFCSSLRKHNMG
jgi:hypothetical protein